MKSLLSIVAAVLFLSPNVPSNVPSPAVSAPKPPAEALQYSIFRTAPIAVAMVFGRAQGCDNAPVELVNEVAEQASRRGVDPRIAAATVAVESGCNGFAISNRGAIGYMQVMPKIWSTKYDCTKRYNYFNLHDNVQVGVSILAENIQRFGVAEGVRRYQGTGTDCATCDGAYTDKILRLAGRR